MKEPLERKLEELRGPAMPADVGARIRERLASADAPGERPPAKGSARANRSTALQWAFAMILLAIGIWVFAHEYITYFVSHYCTPHPPGRPSVHP